MQRITPNLWFNGNAAEAADFYARVLPRTTVTHTDYYPTDGLPDFQRDMAGKELVVEFEVDGYRFLGINAGPEFPINPSLSFMLNFDPSVDAAARDRLDEVWAALSEDGTVLMPLGAYDFSPRYGWLQDRYGTPWQLMLTDPAGEPRPFVIPCLLFGGAAQNRAGEAVEYYTSVFPGSRVGTLVPYPEDTGPAATGSVMFADIELAGQWLALMDSVVEQDYSFTPGVSLMIACADQAEIDHFWDALSAVPEAEQCGWCADRFGVSWQVVPGNWNEYMERPGAYQKMLQMKKIDLAAFG
ncbi:VOC family protein [Propionicicella superfundia]|uniref:VOC family protein n=1 Tax=Propionicicella superfundia TaxID=348582 RepID=UPI0012EC7445|nr:VOC family protein [Propionicicella superfundia]